MRNNYYLFTFKKSLRSPFQPSIAIFEWRITMVDRFSRYPEAIPLRDIEAGTVCRAFYEGWIARFCAPETLSTDQGR